MYLLTYSRILELVRRLEEGVGGRNRRTPPWYPKRAYLEIFCVQAPQVPELVEDQKQRFLVSMAFWSLQLYFQSLFTGFFTDSRVESVDSTGLGLWNA